MDRTLYHYSKNLYPNLKTLKSQGKHKIYDDPVRSKYRPGNYIDHISFFMEKPPIDILGSIYKDNGSDFWIAGNIIYEYVVSVKEMPEFKYEIVESPGVVNIRDDRRNEHLSDGELLALIYEYMHKEKEIGFNKKDFLEQAIKYDGLVRPSYLKLPKRKDWDMLSKLYAPCVPHVLIYPNIGTIKYKNVSSVVIGDELHSAIENIHPLKITKW